MSANSAPTHILIGNYFPDIDNAFIRSALHARRYDCLIGKCGGMCELEGIDGQSDGDGGSAGGGEETESEVSGCLALRGHVSVESGDGGIRDRA